MTWSVILAAGGITGIWLAGRGFGWGWLLGLAMQLLWAAYAVSTGQWGFLLTCAGYGWVYATNARRWVRAQDVPTDTKARYEPYGTWGQRWLPGCCPHDDVRCTHGDEIIARGFRRRVCRRCGGARHGSLPETCYWSGRPHSRGADR